MGVVVCQEKRVSLGSETDELSFQTSVRLDLDNAYQSIFIVSVTRMIVRIGHFGKVEIALISVYKSGVYME